MSYIDSHLLPGEVVTFRTRLHWKIYLFPVIGVVLVLGVAGWVFTHFRSQWSDQTRMIATIVFGVLGVVALLRLGVAWMRRRSSEFAVTNKRVIIKAGVTTTHSMELLLSKIEGITVTQSIWGKMFGFGEIVVTGSGGTHEPFDDIQAPLDFRQAVQAATTG